MDVWAPVLSEKSRGIQQRLEEMVAAATAHDTQPLRHQTHPRGRHQETVRGHQEALCQGRHHRQLW